MKNIIITGADGFIGSRTTEYFIKRGIHVLAIDIREKPLRLQENDLLEYRCINIFNLQQLRDNIEEKKYDVWIQFAWIGLTGKQMDDYELQIRNAMNCVECLKIAAEKQCSKFVGAGSIMEKEVLAIMNEPGRKVSRSYMYGIAKITAHYMCNAIADDLGIEVVWTIITNAYGDGERSQRFISSTIPKLINGEVVEFTAANQNYDFVYIEDVAKAFYLSAEKGKKFCEYIVGSGTARPLKQFILEIFKITGGGEQCSFGKKPYMAISLPLETFNTSKFYKDTGFYAEVSFVEGINKTVEWFKKENEK